MGGDTAAQSIRALRRLSGGPGASIDELHDLIAEFLREVEEGRKRALRGRAYSREELRQLRVALIYIASELGTMKVKEVRVWHVQALIEELREAGVPPGRVSSIVDAFRALFSYALERGLVETSPVLGLPLLGEQPRSDRKVAETRSPTDAMLALGGQVVIWTTRIIVIMFIVIVVALGRELGVTNAMPFP